MEIDQYLADYRRSVDNLPKLLEEIQAGDIDPTLVEHYGYELLRMLGERPEVVVDGTEEQYWRLCGIDLDIYALRETAFDVFGINVDDYMTIPTITLSKQEFEKLVELIESPPSPSPALLAAMKRLKGG